MEKYFEQFRQHIIGIDQEIPVGNGSSRKILYADWIASGRNYRPIEERILNDIMPLVANTHTEANSTGGAMTHAYRLAKEKIKAHVNAGADDVIITASSGMTRVINKFQRILGVKGGQFPEGHRPVVFVTHMEHHSNQTSWLETCAEVEIIQPTPKGEVDFYHLADLLHKYRDNPFKIASVTACSNVTGIETPYHEIARLMHAAGGYCFVDFACSAPYVKIDMHPAEPGAHLDAVFFSPHKFLGGPGSAAVLLFNKDLYNLSTPDHPGGGTVEWTDPWGQHRYIADIEAREDGGTPAFLQTIKTAMCMRLKEQMGSANILKREHELLDHLWSRLEQVPGLVILAPRQKERLGVISFYVEGLHHAIGVRLLNDRYGIQVRGGCSCAGTYAHYLLNMDRENSESIRQQVIQGDHSGKPGWIRVSLHPTMRDEEVEFLGNSIAEVAAQFRKWQGDYQLDACRNQIRMVKGEMDLEIKSRMQRAVFNAFA